MAHLHSEFEIIFKAILFLLCFHCIQWRAAQGITVISHEWNEEKQKNTQN